MMCGASLRILDFCCSIAAFNIAYTISFIEPTITASHPSLADNYDNESQNSKRSLSFATIAFFRLNRIAACTSPSSYHPISISTLFLRDVW